MNEVLAPRLTLYEKPDRLDPQWQWNRAIPAPGHTNVDFEGRVNFDRLRSYRLARARAALEKSECGALILFDVNNIRYITATKIGEWERDKLCRFALLMRGKEPLVWDFGSAAVHHRLYCDWLVPDHVRAGMLGMRGTVPPAAGLMQAHSAEIMSLLNEAGVGKMPVGVDLAETAMLFELQKAGMQVVDGQQVMLDAREIKNIDEIVLLNQAAAMVDGTYHMIYEELKPGVRENDIVAKANEMLYGSAPTTSRRSTLSPASAAIRIRTISPTASSGPATRPSSTSCNRTRAIAPATTAPSTSAARPPCSTTPTQKCREWLDKAIALIKPGVSTDKVASVWPKAEDFGFPSEMAAFGLQFGHGLGLALHERPIISRLVSLEHPMEIRTGMVFALETYCPATDGYSAARIEEEVVVTDKGCQVITLFPAEELPIANAY